MKNIDAALEILAQYSKLHGIYKSEERENILRCINNMDSHFSIASLLNEIKKTQYLSRATIYNNINLFIKAGIIIRHPFPGTDEEYEATWRAATHHHRMCLECGAIKEFTEKKIQTPIKNKHFNAFEKSISSVYLYGLCKKCLNKKKKKEKNIKKD